MRKSIITIMFTVLFIVILTTVVNAAGTKTVNEGDSISITISLGKNTTSAGLENITWSSNLKYNSNSLGKALTNGGKLGFFGDVERSSVTLNFTALKAGTATVKVNVAEVGPDAVNRLDTTTITIVETSTATPTPTPTPKPTTTQPTVQPSKKPTTQSTKKPTVQSTKKPTTSTPTPTIEPTLEPTSAPAELIDLNNEDVKKLEDTNTKVIIKALPIALEDELQLKVVKILEEGDEYKVIEQILNAIKGNKVCYGIQLLENNVEIQPNGYITVFIPIPDEFDKERLEMYNVDTENKTYTLLQGKVQGNYYSFTTDHLSKYVLLETPVSEPTEAPIVEQNQTNIISWEVIYFAIGVLIGVIVTGIIVKITNNKKNKEYRW